MYLHYNHIHMWLSHTVNANLVKEGINAKLGKEELKAQKAFSPNYLPLKAVSHGTISIPMVDNSTEILSGNSKPNISNSHVGHRGRLLQNRLSNYAKLH